MAGLLAGAMAGLGQGIAETGQFLMRVTADEQKEARLQKYEQEREQRQNQRQDALRSEDREWQLEDYQTQRGDAVEDREIGYQQQVGLLQMREAGADRRSAAQIAASSQQRPQWQMVPDGNGGYIQFDPVTNNYREANLPEGVSFSGGELTDRQKLTIETLADERKSIMESSMGQPSDQQAARLGEINAQMEQMLGGGSSGGGDLATRLVQQLGIDSSAEPQEQPAPESAPPRSAPPPRPSTAEGYVGARQQADTAAQSDREADDNVQSLAAEARRIAGRITIPDQFGGGFQRGGLINSATRGGIDTEAEREVAQTVLERVSSAYDQESNPQRKAMLQRALDALYEAGVAR
ncbi:hypothetical protein LG331_08285 [Vreelandella aquamarina]|uniref:hypothetical protein n=1 Tax=Vreelandella aquamarina TaxID=77097 RepID=UPI0038514523